MKKFFRNRCDHPDSLPSIIGDYGETDSSKVDSVVYGEIKKINPVELIKADEVDVAIRAIEDLKKDHLQEK